jgi:hypothetical protein
MQQWETAHAVTDVKQSKHATSVTIEVVAGKALVTNDAPLTNYIPPLLTSHIPRCSLLNGRY